ncbi:MAG: type IV pilus assembly protein PilM [Actinobacteria bacterium]|nr:type IV pilus assembly protein PilM [Chloroflexota bacterium]MCL5292298.1 type IV pilus assembly protein PilM [Actinomycetota bacterium]
MGIFYFGQGTPVGLDIGTNTFRVAQLKPAQDRPILVNSGYIRISPGIVSEGEILDTKAVAEALSDLWRSLRLSEKKVIIGVANQKVVVRLVEMPYIEKTELKHALNYQAQDYIPIPIDEAIMDFDIVGEHTSEDGERMMEVLLVAAQRDMVNNHIEAIQAAGLKPVAIDVSSLAFARSILTNQPSLPINNDGLSEFEALALINIAGGTTNIVVLENEVPRFTRISSFAANSFTEALKDKLRLTYEEAEELKMRVGLPPLKGRKTSEAPDETAAQTEIAQSILEEEMGAFIAEIRRSLDYYLAQATRIRSINRVIISGGGAKMANFPEYLADGLQLDVEIGHPLARIKLSNKLSAQEVADDELSMAVCLGLALRGLEG